ncbi:MAG: hypothetical protein J1G04_02340 [Clostridiales bacterium]|nr:hypothetical protein [Clostridiales bacterium]
MEKKDKIVDKLKLGALSCGSFTAAYAVVTALFFVPYVNSYGGVIVSSVMPLAFLLPFILLPIVYSLMYRFNPLMFGRYHLVMPISAIISALVFVTAFSVTDNSVIGMLTITIGMAVFVFSFLVYLYCMFSVSARRGGAKIGKADFTSVSAAFIGGGAAVGTMYGFYCYDKAAMYSDCALTLAAACLIISFIGYLATFNDVPVLGGKQVRPVKRVFVSFYGGVDKRAYFSALMLLAAFVTIAALSVVHTINIAPSGYEFVVAGSVVTAFVLCYCLARILFNRRYNALVVLATFCLISSAALFITSIFINEIAFVISASALCGGGGAFALKFMGIRFLYIKSRVTSGLVFNLMSLTVCAAFAVALAVAAVATNVKDGFIYGFAFAGLAAIVGPALHINKLASLKKKGSAIAAPDSDENIADEENL